jgi:hypothetical protein
MTSIHARSVGERAPADTAMSDARSGRASPVEEAEEPDFGPARPPHAAGDAAAAAASSAATAVEPGEAESNSASASDPAKAVAGASTAVEPVPASVVPLRRVKLYALSKKDGWEDRGTGHFSSERRRHTRQRSVVDDEGIEVTDPSEEQFMLLVRAETPPASVASTASGEESAPASPNFLLRHLLSDGVEYQIQGSSIITFNLQESGRDVALSFQEPSAAEEAWKLITEQLQFLYPHPSVRYLQQQEVLAQQQEALAQHAREAEAQAAAHAAAAAVAQEQGLLGGLDDDIVMEHGMSMHDLDGSYGSGLTEISFTDPPQQRGNAGGSDSRGQSNELDDPNVVRHLPDDNPLAPPVRLDTLESLQSRMLSQRISRRELLELLELWKHTSAHFEVLRQQDQAAFDEEKRQGLVPSPHSACAISVAAASAVAASAAAMSSSVAASASPVTAASSMDADSSSGAEADASDINDPLMNCLSHLHALFRTMKALLLLNDIEVLEFLFSDEHMDALVGVLEFDPLFAEHPVRGAGPPSPHVAAAVASAPGQPTPPRDFHTHRSFLARAHFKQVVPFHDAVVAHKVHQSYRVTYLKDVVLFAHLDDATLATLTQILFVNAMSIVERLTTREPFVDALFGKLHAFAAQGHTDAERAQIDLEKENAHRLERQQTEVLIAQQAQAQRQTSTPQSQPLQPQLQQQSTVEGQMQRNVSDDSLANQGGSQPPLSSLAADAADALVDAPSVGALLPTAALSASSSSSSVLDAMPQSSSSSQAVISSSTTAASCSLSQSASSSPPSPNASTGAHGGAGASSSSDEDAPTLRNLLLFLQELVLLAKGTSYALLGAGDAF